MLSLNSIVPLLMVEDIELANIKVSFFVAFVMFLLTKYHFFDYWVDIVFNKCNDIFKTKYQDVCYFCFCFWLSFVFYIFVGFNLELIIINSILGRIFYKQITGL